MTEGEARVMGLLFLGWHGELEFAFRLGTLWSMGPWLGLHCQGGLVHGYPFVVC